MLRRLERAWDLFARAICLAFFPLIVVLAWIELTVVFPERASLWNAVKWCWSEWWD